MPSLKESEWTFDTVASKYEKCGQGMLMNCIRKNLIMI